MPSSTEEFKNQTALLKEYGYGPRLEGTRWLWLDPWYHVVSREFALKAIAEKIATSKQQKELIS